MNLKGFRYLLLPLLLLAAIYFFVINPEILGRNLNGSRNIPLGTLISWSIVFAYGTFSYLLYSPKIKSGFSKIVQIVLIVNLILCTIWGVISFLLSGNWAFNFSDQLMFKFWVLYTIFIFLIPIFMALAGAIKRIFL